MGIEGNIHTEGTGRRAFGNPLETLLITLETRILPTLSAPDRDEMQALIDQVRRYERFMHDQAQTGEALAQGLVIELSEARLPKGPTSVE